MAKSLLILMLVATHLLAGSRASIELCVSHDGSHWCLDSGEASCTCCRVPHEARHDACSHEQQCVHEATESACGTHAAGGASTAWTSELTAEPCDCTHILLVAASDHPAYIVRSRLATDRQEGGVDFALAADDRVIEPEALRPAVRPYDSSAIPDYALIVVSTVVLRC